MPVLKRRLRFLAYTSVRVLQCIHMGHLCCIRGCKQTHVHLQVIVWAVLTLLQTLPFWQALKPFWPQGRTLFMHVTVMQLTLAGLCDIYHCLIPSRARRLE